jgi:hypothetical protein
MLEIVDEALSTPSDVVTTVRGALEWLETDIVFCAPELASEKAKLWHTKVIELLEMLGAK